MHAGRRAVVKDVNAFKESAEDVKFHQQKQRNRFPRRIPLLHFMRIGSYGGTTRQEAGDSRIRKRFRYNRHHAVRVRPSRDKQQRGPQKSHQVEVKKQPLRNREFLLTKKIAFVMRNFESVG